MIVKNPVLLSIFFFPFSCPCIRFEVFNEPKKKKKKVAFNVLLDWLGEWIKGPLNLEEINWKNKPTQVGLVGKHRLLSHKTKPNQRMLAQPEGASIP